MFNRSAIFTAAWRAYHSARLGVYLPSDASGRRSFIAAMYAKCLRSAWADARKRAGWIQPLVATAKALPAMPTPARAAEIRTELDRMQYRDFIDWNAHRTLSAELATTYA